MGIAQSSPKTQREILRGFKALSAEMMDGRATQITEEDERHQGGRDAVRCLRWAAEANSANYCVACAHSCFSSVLGPRSIASRLALQTGRKGIFLLHQQGLVTIGLCVASTHWEGGRQAGRKRTASVSPINPNGLFCHPESLPGDGGPSWHIN